MGQEVKLLSHPKRGTYAPIAISQGLIKTWIYKDGWDQKCNGEPNDKDYLVKLLGECMNEAD